MRLIRIGHFPGQRLLLGYQAIQAGSIAMVPTGNHGWHDDQHQGQRQAQ